MRYRAALGLVSLASMTLLVSGVPPAAAAPTDLVCGQTITSDVTFTHDVTGCTGNGLVVGAPNVTINLNGHRLAALDFYSPVGVRDDGFGGMRLIGGRVENFETSVFVYHSDHAFVGHLQITGSLQGVLVSQSAAGTLVDNDISSGVGGSGVVLDRAQRYKVVGNRLSHNGDGIVLGEASHNRLAHNVSSDSRSGIELLSSVDNVLVGNRVDREQTVGILLVNHSDDNVVLRNHANGSVSAGIQVSGSAGNRVRKNVASDNLGGGIAVVDDAIDTRLSRNRADRNGASPPDCGPTCPRLDDGIHVDAPRTTLARNQADSNADLGIAAVAGVTDGGRNKAHDNGDARECVNVICR